MEPTPVPVAKKRGRLFYAGVVSVFLAAGALLAAVVLVNGARNFLRTYTGSAALEFPAAAPLPPVEFEALAEKLRAFKGDGDVSPSTASIVLGEDEINALLAVEPRFIELGARLRVTFTDGTIRARMSVPLEESGIPFVRGRYLNADVALKVSLEDGVLLVMLESLILNEKSLPETLMAALKSENLAKDLYRRPKAAEAIPKFRSIRVGTGRISIELRS
jgi:hypothetical protein